MRAQQRVYFFGLNYSVWLPYTYGVLRAYAEADSFVRFNYAFMPPKFILEPLADLLRGIDEPSVACFSCYVWNFRHHISIARAIKQHYPDCRIIFGGPHVPRDAEPFLTRYPFIDFIVHEEGEEAFCSLLRMLHGEPRDLNMVPGISFVWNGRTVKTPPSRLLKTPLPIASPYRNGYFDDAIDSLNRSCIPFSVLWETNRGCPYSCSFCDWGVNSVNKIRLFDLEHLAADIRYFSEFHIDTVYLSDANFGILSRDEKIVDMLVESKSRTGYPRVIRANFAKNSNERVFQMSRKLAAAEMSAGTTLSLQSTAPPVLSAVRRDNIGIERYSSLAKRYRQNGIHSYTELILGLPGETKLSFMRGICDLLESGNHEDFRIYELILLPNAPLSSEAERRQHGLETVWKPLYTKRRHEGSEETEMVEVVIATTAMSYTDWI